MTSTHFFITDTNKASMIPVKNSSHEVQAYLTGICDLLEAQTDLSPENTIITTNLQHLVQQIIDWTEANSLSLEELQQNIPHVFSRLPGLCAKAEYEMEKWWTDSILKGVFKLEDFWYYDNYTHLINSELSLLDTNKYNRVVFLGSGPLPLTAILAAKNAPSSQFICVDRDPTACSLSKKLIDTLNLNNQLSVHMAAAEIYTFSKDDLVICASLLESSELYETLHKHNVSQIIIRDALDLYQLLYKPAKLPDPTIYTEIRRTALQSKCINTSRYFERAEL